MVSEASQPPAGARISKGPEGPEILVPQIWIGLIHAAHPPPPTIYRVKKNCVI